MNPTTTFILITISFFIILISYVFYRRNWLEKEKQKYPNHEFIKTHDEMIYEFWNWDIETLIKRRR